MLAISERLYPLSATEFQGILKYFHSYLLLIFFLKTERKTCMHCLVKVRVGLECHLAIRTELRYDNEQHLIVHLWSHNCVCSPYLKAAEILWDT